MIYENLTPEQRHLWDLFAQSIEEENKVTLEIEEFNRKSFPVSAVRVTDENMDEVAEWCKGVVRREPAPKPPGEKKYIKVRVDNPLGERQTKAYVGDWVLYAGKGYKVYEDRAFKKSFIRTETIKEIDVPNVTVSIGEDNFVKTDEGWVLSNNVFADGDSGTSTSGSAGTGPNPGGSHG